MMKKIALYIGIAIVAIGCAKDNIGETTLSAEAIEFSATVESDETRVLTSDDCVWEINDEIGIFTSIDSDTNNMLFKIVADDAENYPNVMTNGKMDGAILYATESRTYYAYYPYNTAYNSTSTININCATSQSYFLLWASKTSANPQVELTFKHMLPKVTFNLTPGGKDVISLDGAVVTLKGANATATFDIEGDGTFSSTQGDITLTLNNGTVTAYMLPTAVANSTVTLWVAAKDSKTNTFYYPITERWVSGSSYVYNITVGEVPETN